MRNSLISRQKKNSRFFSSAGLLLIIVLVVFYVFQINQMTGAVYSIGDCEKRINSLSLENKKLEIDFSQANSLANIEARIRKLDYEPIKELRYIRIFEGTAIK